MDETYLPIMHAVRDGEVDGDLLAAHGGAEAGEGGDLSHMLLVEPHDLRN